MRAIYNGIDLLPLNATHEFIMEPVYDDSGTDYLYSRVIYASQSVVNGQASVVDNLSSGNGPPMSYKLDPDEASLSTDTGGVAGLPRTASNNPVYPASGEIGLPTPSVPSIPNGATPTTPGDSGVDKADKSTLRGIIRTPNAPLLTHEAIRHRLTTPRGKLYLFAGGGMERGTPPAGKFGPPNVEDSVLCLESPEEGMVCDCKNGPNPKLLGVQAVFGDATTMIVDWAVETFVMEGSKNFVNPTGALLSHRFAQQHIIDDRGFTTILTAGAAIFRTDRLYQFLMNPDSQRPFIFMPVPLNFVRQDIQVKGIPDVSGIQYQYVDRQVPVNFPAGQTARAASITALHRQAISTGNILEGALSTYERYLNLKVQKKWSDDDATDNFASQVGARLATYKPGMKPPERGE